MRKMLPKFIPKLSIDGFLPGQEVYNVRFMVTPIGKPAIYVFFIVGLGERTLVSPHDFLVRRVVNGVV